MLKSASKSTITARIFVVFAAICGSALLSGCGVLSQGRLGAPFGSAAEEKAFEKAVAADSFPKANEALLKGMSGR